MKVSRWFIAALFVFCVLLAFESYMVLSGLQALAFLESIPEGRDVVSDPITRPLLYALALSTVPFAILGAVFLVGALCEQSWVKRGLLVASICFVVAVIAVVAIAPHLWLDHGILAMFAVAYWLHLREKRGTSAL